MGGGGVFLVGCKNAADSGGAGGGGAPASQSPSSSNNGTNAPLYFDDPTASGAKTPLNYSGSDQTNIPFNTIKSLLPTPKFGDTGYENSDGKVFVGWSTDGSTVIPDNSTVNVAGKELKPVYDTAVVFTIYKYDNSTSTQIGKIYKVAQSKVPTGGITFDEIQQKAGVKTSDLQKPDNDFHWSTKENDTGLTNTIKFTDKFSTTQNFYTAYDPYPTSTNRKNPITASDLFDSSGSSEWLQYTTDANGNPTYKYLIFTNTEMSQGSNIFRVAYGEANTLIDAQNKAYTARDAVDSNGDPDWFYGIPVIQGMPYATGLEIKTDGSIDVWTSPVTTFWMNNSGRIVAQTDGKVADTNNMYVAQK